MREIRLPGGLGALTRHGGSAGHRASGPRAPGEVPDASCGGATSDDSDSIPVVVLRETLEDSGPESRSATHASPLVAEAVELLSETETRTGRDILVKYDETFLGVYHAPRKITNKTAYQTLAAVVRGERPDFDPEKLVLYRPVPLTPPAPEEILAGRSVGRFTRFDRPGGTEAVG